MVQVIIQPGDGIGALIKAIDRARKSIEIMIFRFDEREIEQALTRAAERGVFVHALIAFTNHGGEEHLRKLEQHLLQKGITVARTADDLVRYHAKYMVIDEQQLFLLAFNFSHLDIERSRSFGIITSNHELVNEARKLFECDVKRLSYKSGSSQLVVSPVNARQVLGDFISGAKRELLIYDPEVSDRALVRLLGERAKAGVRIAIIGKVTKKATLDWRKLNGMRLHTRVILRDGLSAFVGSQSLRKLELDSRREAGVIFRDSKVVGTMRRIFEKDWDVATPVKKTAKLPVKKTAKRVAKVMTKRLPLAPVVSHVVEVIRQDTNLTLHPKEVEDTVKEAVKDALKDAVKDAAKRVVKTVVEQEL